MGPLGGGKGEREVRGKGVGSLSPTRDKCGRTFAPRASKGDSQVSMSDSLHGQKQGVGRKGKLK